MTIVSTMFVIGAALAAGATMIQNPIHTTMAGAKIKGKIFKAMDSFLKTNRPKNTVSNMNVHIV